jgi:hypothetical protein
MSPPPLCVLKKERRISPLSLSLPFFSLALRRANNNGNKECRHHHPKTIEGSKLLDFSCSSAKLGRKARR